MPVVTRYSRDHTCMEPGALEVLVCCLSVLGVKGVIKPRQVLCTTALWLVKSQDFHGAARAWRLEPQEFQKILLYPFICSYMGGFGGFEPFSGLPMMFRRVVFFPWHFFFYSFFLPQTFPFQPVVMPPVVALQLGSASPANVPLVTPCIFLLLLLFTRS